MTELDKVIEEDNILVFLSPTGRIRACDLTEFKSKLNVEQLYQKEKPVYVLLSEDMEQLQEADYIFQDNALWLRYGCALHRKIIENSFQRYLDKETYNEDQPVWQVK